MAEDMLKPHRQAVAKAIASLRSFTGQAGSAEMKSAHAALDYMGMAYNHLTNVNAIMENPAWDGKAD